VPLSFRAPACAGDFAYRIISKEEFQAPNQPWMAFLPGQANELWESEIEIPAGGWYRLQLRCATSTRTIESAAVEPIGVGEVFLIAGQSNAGGYSDGRMLIDDPQQRVVAYNIKTGEWAVANDPQPNAGPGGSIWPPMCNALVSVLDVPIGMVNVAVDSTSSSQWLPGDNLFPLLAKAARTIRQFRAVLWQQGESDVIGKTTTVDYVDHLTTIRTALENEAGVHAPWLLAKSTFHPTVYNDPVHEAQIRDAIDILWKTSGFLPGPDTDILAGSNRGGPNSRRHFTAEGQKHAGLMWFAIVWSELFCEQSRLSSSVSTALRFN